MANDSCSFSSINDLLGQANAGKINITTVVSSCPGTCSLAWGTGNPDLSGVGTNISYILQAILTFLFGPLFCLFYRQKWRFSERTEEIVELLHDTFLDVSAQFSISVAVAAVIRFRQHAPIYEIAFLRSLTTMQFLSLLSIAVIPGIFKKRKGDLRIFVIVLYGLIEFGFYMGLIGGLYTNKNTWEAISELRQACRAYGEILPWFKYIPKPHVNVPHITAKQYFNPFSKVGWKFAGIIAGFIFAGCLALSLAVLIIVALISFVISKPIVSAGLTSLAFTIGMLVEVVQMERTRNDMKSITGAEFQDNQWGFGQVISLFLWVPLCIQIVYYGRQIVFATPTTPSIKQVDTEKAKEAEKLKVPRSGLGSSGAVDFVD